MSNKLEGITWHAQGEANFYRLMRGNHWVAIVQLNGEMLVWDQEQLLNAMLQGQQAAPVGEPDCDRSACGDFSPGPCDNTDCPALRSNKAAPVGEPDDDRTAIHQLAFELGGTEGGEYLLDLDDLNAVIDAARQRQQALEVVMPDDLSELLTEIVDIHRRRGVVLTIHIEQIANMLTRLNKGAGSHE